MRNQRGLTLLEAAISLTIFGLIIAGVWVASAQVNFNNHLNRTERGMAQTISNVINFYAGRTAVAGFNTDTARNFDLIAPELIIGNVVGHTLVAGSDFGSISLGVDTGLCGSSPTAYFFQLDQLSLQGCNQLLPRMAGSASKIDSTHLLGAYVNGTNVLANDSVGRLVFNAGAAMNACGAEANQIIFCLNAN